MNYEAWRGTVVQLAIVAAAAFVVWMSPRLSSDIVHAALMFLGGIGGASVMSAKRIAGDGGGSSGGLSMRPPPSIRSGGTTPPGGMGRIAVGAAAGMGMGLAAAMLAAH